MSAHVTNIDPQISQEIDKIAQSVAGSEAGHSMPDPLQPTQFLQSKIEAQIKLQFNRFLKKIQTGLQDLFATLQHLAQQDTQCPYQAILDQCKEFKPASEPGTLKSPRDEFGFDDKAMKAFNQAAAYLYEQKEFEKLIGVYTLLSYLEPEDQAYWLGLGNAEYFCRHYESALLAYEAAIEADPKNPDSYLFASHCYEQLGQLDRAIELCDEALGVIASNPAMVNCREKAANLKSMYIKKL